MALITDPDDLSQGLETAVSDAVFTSSSGANTTITSAGSELPGVANGDIFEVRDHSTSGNNGLYVATGSPTAASVSCTKIDGTDPADAASEAIRTFGDDHSTAEYKSVMIDTLQKRVYLIEQGNLSVDGVTLQALYSFLKEEWKTDDDLIQNAFPIVSITPEQFEFSDDWEPRDVTSPEPVEIQSKKLIRTAGWSELDSSDVIIRQYMGAITLGTFEDTANDTAYYQLGNDPTDTTAAIDFTFAGPVNESILVYEDIGVLGNLAITGNDTITRLTGSFIADGFRIGGRVTITDSEDAGNDGVWTLSDVTATTLVISGGGLTNNADDDTMRLAVDNRNAVTLRVRVRDADPNGKTFDQSTLADIGFSAVDNKAFRFPLANATDLQISATDAAISGTPWSEVRIRYLPETYNREVDSTTKRDFGIIIDVGTYSRGNGASATSTLFTSADHVLGAGEALSDYTGGSLIIHEGTDQGTHTISGTPVDNAGTLEITVTVALTATESNLSFTMERATPLTADQNEIYEKVQYQLRQDADIDETNGVVTGRTADELISFVASNDVRYGEGIPTNPNGGGSGVIVEGFDANDTNNYSFFDNGGTSRTFPFVAAGSISFNANLTSDTAPEYWMFFEYTTQTSLADGAVVTPSGDTYDLESPGSNLPALVVNDYINVQGFANVDNNGLFVVTVVNTSTQDYTVRRIDGGSVGAAESGVTITVDENPIDTPDAIIVDDNGGFDIVGSAASSPVAFDFDYDNNAQGGRTPGTDAVIRIRAIGLETGQFAEVSGTIQRAVGQSFSVVAALERNYSNP